MHIEQVSIKWLAITILLVIGSIASSMPFIAGNYVRNSALAAQAKSLSRIIEIASDETIRHLQNDATSFGSDFQNRSSVRNSFLNLLESGQPERMIAQLDEPFHKGFIGLDGLDLVKLRVYDSNLKFLCESREGILGLTPQLPRFLLEHAMGRKGVERLKGLDGLWTSSNGPLYSLLIPIGGIHLTGYLEVVVNPTFSLSKVASLAQMPLKAYNLNGKLIYQSEQQNKSSKGIQLTVEYLLKAENGELLYRIVGLENAEQFSNDMRKTQNTAVIIFLAMTISALIFGIWAFTRFIISPINHIMNDINRYFTDGKLRISPDRGNTKEFHSLANAFAAMAHKIEINIHELERISRLDSLTGIANRRTLDTALKNEWKRAQRDKTALSFLMIDIDFFKLYNDHFGHQGGDDCLKMIAAKIAQVVTRPADLVVRYGGEEFAALLPGTSSEGAASVANQMIDAIATLKIPHPESTVSNIVTLSIGISTLIPGSDSSSAQLIKLADDALYRAKKAGRNQIK